MPPRLRPYRAHRGWHSPTVTTSRRPCEWPSRCHRRDPRRCSHSGRGLHRHVLSFQKSLSLDSRIHMDIGLGLRPVSSNAQGREAEYTSCSTGKGSAAHKLDRCLGNHQGLHVQPDRGERVEGALSGHIHGARCHRLCQAISFRRVTVLRGPVNYTHTDTTPACVAPANFVPDSRNLPHERGDRAVHPVNDLPSAASRAAAAPAARTRRRRAAAAANALHPAHHVGQACAGRRRTSGRRDTAESRSRPDRRRRCPTRGARCLPPGCARPR